MTDRAYWGTARWGHTRWGVTTTTRALDVILKKTAGNLPKTLHPHHAGDIIAGGSSRIEVSTNLYNRIKKTVAANMR